MLRFPRIASCRGKGLIVVLGADLWLTGLSGAQSVGHSTNLRYPCPWWLLGKDRLTGWFILWMTDWSNDDGVVEFVADSQVTHSLYHWVVFWTPHPPFLWRGGTVVTFGVWVLIQHFTTVHTPSFQLCESMISWDCSVLERALSDCVSSDSFGSFFFVIILVQVTVLKVQVTYLIVTHGATC